MTAKFLIVDSCAYLRLAASVHPNFWGGHPHYELRSIAETDPELAGTRLRRKFLWLNRDPHPSLRKKWQLKTTKQELLDIEDSKEFLLEHSEEFLEGEISSRRKYDRDGEELPFLSVPDLAVLAVAYHFQYGILTDELALTLVAKDLGLPTMSSLKMLKYFLDQGFVNDAKVDAIMQQWSNAIDLPHTGWAGEFKKVFKRPAPKLVGGNS
jgi:hypothetical protein